jgi:hypothetical protein
MSKFDDRLADYVDVKERVRLFYQRHPEGRLTTLDVSVTREPDDVPRVWVHAQAFRTPDDPHPGDGWSWMALPGSTPYTRGSEIENAETSAWGRAIGSLGIGIDKSIASADEVRAKGGEVKADVDHGDDGSLIGTAEVGAAKTSDFLVRDDANLGPTLGFRLRGQRGGILVRASGPLAEQLWAHRDDVIGKRVTCWGRVTDVPGSTNPPRRGYQVLAAERVSVPGIGVLPTHATPPPDVPQEPSGGPTEAPSETLFDAEEQRLLDEAMGVAGGIR